MFVPVFAVIDWVHYYQCMLKSTETSEMIFFTTPCPTEQFYATKPATINNFLKYSPVQNTFDCKIIYAYLCQLGQKTIYHFINTCRSLTVFKDDYTCYLADENDIPITMFVSLDVTSDLIEWAKDDIVSENPHIFQHYPLHNYAVLTVSGIRTVVDVIRQSDSAKVPSKCIIQ